ncbi:DNA-directed RNA polymerases I like protein [Verticillium longisporum]|nr:DNA-directed RNA polymerases I like protein [Verticillium longisporum]
MEGNDGQSKEVVRAWRAWRTVHEMCADRGYELAESEIQISLDRFRHEYLAADGSVNRSKLTFSARPSSDMLSRHTPAPSAANPNPDPDCGPIYIEFIAEQGSLGVQHLRRFVQHVLEGHFKAGIMVTSSPLTSAGRKQLLSLESFARIECFLEEDLLVNITHHELVPKHILLSTDEKAVLLKRYRLKETQLPRIKREDPVARYLGLKRGNVVKIIRNSETAGRYASYRYCTKKPGRPGETLLSVQYIIVDKLKMASQGGETVNLSTLDVQQLGQVKKQIEQELEHLTQSFAQLHAVQGKFKECQRIVKTRPGSVEGERSVLVPLTNSLYVRGELSDPGRVFVDVGTGFYVEKESCAAELFYNAKIKQLAQNIQDLEVIVQRKTANVRSVEDVLRQKVMAGQASETR